MVLALLLVAQAFYLLLLLGLMRFDYIRLTRPSCRVEAEVVRFKTVPTDGIDHYAPVYRFSSEGAEHEVADHVDSFIQQPPVGTTVALRHPAGRPDMAYVHRPVMHAFVYIFFAGIEGALLWLTFWSMAR
ncbi:DUF3592 domain-containing protein [Novosphingobium sp. AAP93]|uniref:DUF3592 domain-containing protein n=1 Tax=Novosphingobium sp. AAP93 TaxID=1523427 RepID=UPI0006B8848B|nr:DUF3592 domain-containing protein [Novosphingobium sp. AAP93]KPF78012.1 hypothetical protein IP83_19030 [Novosphingobium sp. AAP93]